MNKREPISDEYCHFGEKLKTIRLSHNMTQVEVAKCMRVSKTTVVNYEMGTRKIPLSYLVQFAKHFNVSVDEILGISTEPTEKLTDDELVEVIRFTKYIISRRSENK